MPNKDIDHLTRILVLCGTPDTELKAKITNDEVRLINSPFALLNF